MVMFLPPIFASAVAGGLRGFFASWATATAAVRSRQSESVVSLRMARMIARPRRQAQCHDCDGLVSFRAAETARNPLPVYKPKRAVSGVLAGGAAASRRQRAVAW
jgi:hypothetical protein